jgi:Zn-dependent peptidase ImmA (M78 family)
MGGQISNRDIEYLANGLTKSYNKKEYVPIVALIDILNRYNLTYDVYNFKISKFSGMLHLLEGQYIIVVNEIHHIKKRIFTVAHEIGHYLLHLDLMPEFFCNEIFKISNKKIETEANRFAAEILMPTDTFVYLIKKNGTNFTSIAMRLNISEEAVRWRYVDLCNEYANIPKDVLIQKIVVPYKNEQERKFNMKQAIE